MFSRSDVVNTISLLTEAIPGTDGSRRALGEALLFRLETYSEFYFRLFNQRKVDQLLIPETPYQPIPEEQGAYASLTIGGLTLTSRYIGVIGNTFTAEVKPSIANTFSVVGIPEAVASRLLEGCIAGLYGAVGTVSSDPATSALQAQASASLMALSSADKAVVENQIRAGWDQYRVSRTESDLEKAKPSIMGALEGVKLTDLSEYAEGEYAEDLEPDVFGENKVTLETGLDTEIQRQNDFKASTFDLVLKGHGVTETYPFSAPLNALGTENSAIVSSAVWASSTRPSNGTYQFSGGVNPVPGRSGVITTKPDREYKLTLDDDRTFTLPDLEEIVTTTLAASLAWLSQTNA